MLNVILHNELLYCLSYSVIVIALVGACVRKRLIVLCVNVNLAHAQVYNLIELFQKLADLTIALLVLTLSFSYSSLKFASSVISQRQRMIHKPKWPARFLTNFSKLSFGMRLKLKWTRTQKPKVT